MLGSEVGVGVGFGVGPWVLPLPVSDTQAPPGCVGVRAKCVPTGQPLLVVAPPVPVSVTQAPRGCLRVRPKRVPAGHGVAGGQGVFGCVCRHPCWSWRRRCRYWSRRRPRGVLEYAQNASRPDSRAAAATCSAVCRPSCWEGCWWRCRPRSYHVAGSPWGRNGGWPGSSRVECPPGGRLDRRAA